MIEQPLCPRLEAQIHRVLSAFQKAWKMEAASSPPLQKAVGNEDEDGRSTTPDKDRKAVEEFYRANPTATMYEAMKETGISPWRCRRVREQMGLPRPRQKREDSMRQHILAALVRDPEASIDDIVRRTGARRKYAAEVMRLKRFGLI